MKDLIETKAAGDGEKDDPAGDGEKDEPPKKKATGHSMWQPWQMWKDLWDLRRSI